MQYIAGIDEVGRGPIAGPLTVCCAWIEKSQAQKILRKLKKEGLTDSKKLSKKKREYFAGIAQQLKKEGRLDYACISISALRIDTVGLSVVIKKAIKNAIKIKAPSKNISIFLDGRLKAPAIFTNQKTIIKGDLKIPIISLASIIAKVHRDAYMQKLHKKYPLYGFDTHVGYGTKKHYLAIKKHGLTPLHRKTWISAKSLIY